MQAESNKEMQIENDGKESDVVLIPKLLVSNKEKPMSYKTSTLINVSYPPINVNIKFNLAQWSFISNYL